MAVRPVDALLAGYLGFVTVVIVARGGLADPANWWLLGAHGLFGILIALFGRLGPADRLGRLAHDLYPLVLLPALYAELGVLSLQLGVDSTFARDAVVQRWEAALFGGQISYTWIREAPSIFWSATLHLAYVAYYPIVLSGPLLLTLRGRSLATRHVVVNMMIAFVLCYLVFVLFPVAGPNYAFEHPTGAVREVWSARLVYGVLGTGSSFGAAFPSSHVAATLSAVGALWRVWPRLAAVLVIPTILLVVGTVYCQMHYGVDALAGLAVGGIALALGRTLET